jgi:hypothetical protein
LLSPPLREWPFKLTLALLLDDIARLTFPMCSSLTNHLYGGMKRASSDGIADRSLKDRVCQHKKRDYTVHHVTNAAKKEEHNEG